MPIESDFDPARLRSNTFELEWPRGSGSTQEFPEIDRAAWFDCETARRKLAPGQAPFIDALEARACARRTRCDRVRRRARR